MKKIISLSVICFGLVAMAQNARIKGVLLNEAQQAVPYAQLRVGTTTSISNANGFFSLIIPAEKEVTVSISHVSYQTLRIQLQLKTNEELELFPVMNNKAAQLGTITIMQDGQRKAIGFQALSAAAAQQLPGANAGIENLLKSLPGVNSNNELSTQYAVRGGNYDENLVYVNGIEVYRPFLIRSGQQEGLSFTHTQMVDQIAFSAGGFQAQYGDKLSSVLDITYRTPTRFQNQLELSFLGGQLTTDWASKNKKWQLLSGLRYRNNQLLVKNQETQSNYQPRFADAQLWLNYQPTQQFSVAFLGNLSQNNYQYQPLSRQTNFGTISNPIALQIFYEGQEIDHYKTAFGAVKMNFSPQKNNHYQWITSAYHTLEQEYYDILAAYRLGEVDSNIGSSTFGDVVFSRGVGSQLNHARNLLDAVIVNSELKGNHQFANKKHSIDWGLKAIYENIKDRIVEYEIIDSAGFSIRPPKIDYTNNQPYNPYTAPLAAFQSVRATQSTNIYRATGFLQYQLKTNWKDYQWQLTAGIRTQTAWLGTENGSSFWSPRMQLSVKPLGAPHWQFRLATGYYHQPPSYREYRNTQGKVVPSVKAQQSVHWVFGNDYHFLWKNRPFKLITEVYYKNLTDVNTYSIDNVRIRYAANNNAVAYIYGADLRLHGEWVPGTDSWLSFGYMKTEENQNNKGYIARPTDQRLKFAVLFQDYMPNLPNMRVYLSLTYNSGLPGGAPAYADPYQYNFKLPDYKRADVGFSYVFKDAKTNSHRKWLQHAQSLSLGFEIFNLFNTQNSITNTWVRDVYTKNQYGIPNYMTNRTFNLKLSYQL